MVSANRWLTTQRRLIPTGMILPMLAGYDIDPDWALFSDADGKAICLTESDAQLGTSAAATAVSISTLTGGAHTSGSTRNDVVGFSVAGVDNDAPYSWDGNSYGAHTHPIIGDYTPQMNTMRLVRAMKNTNVPSGCVMFATAAAGNQAAFSDFDGNGGIVAGGAAQAAVPAGRSLTLGASSMAYHHHHTKSYTRQYHGIASGRPTMVNNAGASHDDHDISTITITPDLRRVMVRAYRIVDALGITGLMGFWLDGGDPPPGWEIVAGLGDRCLALAADGDGALAGQDIISLAGTSGGSIHSHGITGNSSLEQVGDAYHGSLTHYHSVSESQGYTPARFFMKLLRYVRGGM